VLAVISIGVYNGIQQRANAAKVDADLTQLSKAIHTARITIGDQALRYVTGNTATASPCATKPADTDLAAIVDKDNDPCWQRWRLTLANISSASGINVNNLIDPWGRPYFMDENEKEGVTQCGTGKDSIGLFLRPLTGS